MHDIGGTAAQDQEVALQEALTSARMQVEQLHAQLKFWVSATTSSQINEAIRGTGRPAPWLKCVTHFLKMLRRCPVNLVEENAQEIDILNLLGVGVGVPSWWLIRLLHGKPGSHRKWSKQRNKLANNWTDCLREFTRTSLLALGW